MVLCAGVYYVEWEMTTLALVAGGVAQCGPVLRGLLQRRIDMTGTVVVQCGTTLKTNWNITARAGAVLLLETFISLVHNDSNKCALARSKLKRDLNTIQPRTINSNPRIPSPVLRQY